MKPQPPSGTKRPYEPPKLLVYGDLTEMTRAMGMLGMLDGGVVMGMKKSG